MTETNATTIDWMAQAQALRDELVACRRDLHRHPELAFEEIRTAGIVAAELGKLGLEVQTGIGKTGVVGILEGAQDGPTILARFDMDALPVREANQTEYVSQTEGKMHACGHDGHTSIGLAVAKMLTAHRAQIAGRIKFVFQPAEETGKGAPAMIKDGVLDTPVPTVALGLHLWNAMPVGYIGVTGGPTMAGANDFYITIRGKGGHGAIPEETHDPIVAGAQIVNALQTIVSRNVSALDTAVVSVCTFHAGHATNVIPGEAKLTGTFRAYSQERTDLLMERLREITTGIASAMGCEADVELVRLTPPLINDEAVSARLRAAFGQVKAPLHLLDSARTMAAEDMAFFLEKLPGVFFFVGSANAARELDFPHHHPRFDFDEDALPVGAGLLATAIASYVIPE
jgi:amidohydrolase